MLKLVFLAVVVTVAAQDFCEAPNECQRISLDFCGHGLIPSKFCFEDVLFHANQEALRRVLDDAVQSVWNAGADTASSWDFAKERVQQLAGPDAHFEPGAECELFYRAVFCNTAISNTPSVNGHGRGDNFAVCDAEGRIHLKPCFTDCVAAHTACALDEDKAVKVCLALSQGDHSTVAAPEADCFFVDTTAVPPPPEPTDPPPPSPDDGPDGPDYPPYECYDAHDCPQPERGQCMRAACAGGMCAVEDAREGAECYVPGDVATIGHCTVEGLCRPEEGGDGDGGFDDDDDGGDGIGEHVNDDGDNDNDHDGDDGRDHHKSRFAGVFFFLTLVVGAVAVVLLVRQRRKMAAAAAAARDGADLDAVDSGDGGPVVARAPRASPRKASLNSALENLEQGDDEDPVVFPDNSPLI